MAREQALVKGRLRMGALPALPLTFIQATNRYRAN